MKVQLASDLHLEFIERRFPGERLVAPDPACDVLVLAGDIHQGTRGVQLFSQSGVPVVYVAGNHEFYGRQWEETREDLKRAAAGTQVHVLDNDAVVIGGVRFLGCTLWTDFRQRGHTQRHGMRQTEAALRDFYVIRTATGTFRATDALADHERSVAWLDEQLSAPFDGPTVVVTHHAPHPLSIHRRFVGDPVNAGFVSDLTPLLRKAQLWLHGHVHDSFDYHVNGCRVVANPRGYELAGLTSSVSNLTFENAQFQPACLIDVALPGAGDHS